MRSSFELDGKTGDKKWKSKINYSCQHILSWISSHTQNSNSVTSVNREKEKKNTNFNGNEFEVHVAMCFMRILSFSKYRISHMIWGSWMLVLLHIPPDMTLSVSHDFALCMMWCKQNPIENGNVWVNVHFTSELNCGLVENYVKRPYTPSILRLNWKWFKWRKHIFFIQQMLFRIQHGKNFDWNYIIYQIMLKKNCWCCALTTIV